MDIAVDGHDYRVEFSHRKYKAAVKLYSYRFGKRKERHIRGATRCRIWVDDVKVGEGWSRCSIMDAWNTDAARTKAFGRALDDGGFNRGERAQMWLGLWLELERAEAEQRRRMGRYAAAAEEEGKGVAEKDRESHTEVAETPVLRDREDGGGLSAQQAEPDSAPQRSFRC